MNSTNRAHTTAIHMAGLAMLQSLFRPDAAATEITIVPSQGAAGFVSYRNDAHSALQTLDEIRKEGIASMAGVVAAQELLHTADTGCIAGMIRAAALAMRYVSLSHARLHPDMQRQRATEVLDDWKAECQKLVLENEPAIRKVSAALIERGTISGAELTALLN